jgi:hypothetical protein
MSGSSASNTPGGGAVYRDGIDSYRTVAKWVVSSFGAVAAALVVGLQLTSLGELHGSRLFWAILCVSAAFGSTLAVIAAASRVLVPRRMNYHGFAKSADFQPLRDELALDKSPLNADEVDTAADLAKRYEAFLSYRKKLRRKNETEPNPVAAKALEEADEDVAILYGKVMTLTWLGRFLRAGQIYRQAMVVLYAATVIAVAGAVGFAYVSSQPTNAKPPEGTNLHVTVGWPRSCARLYFALNKLADDEPHVGSLWPAGSLRDWDRTCGLRSRRDVARALKFLGRH